MRWFAGHLHTDDHSNCASGGLTCIECIGQGEGRTKDGSSRNTNMQGSESVLSRGRQTLRGNISGTRARRGHCPQSPGKRVILEGKRGQRCEKLLSYLFNDLPYWTGNSSQYSIMAYLGKESKESGYMYN